MSFATDSQVIQKLEEYEKAGEQSEFVKCFRELLHIQMQARKNYTELDWKPGDKGVPGAPSERTALGLPLLTYEALKIDCSQFKTVFLQIIDLIKRYYPEREEEIKNLTAVATGSGALEMFCRLWYQGESAAALKENEGVSSELLDFALQATFRPFLVVHSERLAADIDQEKWRLSYCPVCGGNPDLAILDKEGARWLVCARCDTRWLFQRLECPFCGNRAPDSLGYFSTNENSYRLYVCETCKGYIKGIDLRKAESEVLIPLERILTLDLDCQAQAENYKAGHIIK